MTTTQAAALGNTKHVTHHATCKQNNVTCNKQHHVTVTCNRQNSDVPLDVVIGDLNVVRKLGVQGVIRKVVEERQCSGGNSPEKTGSRRAGNGRKCGGIETLDSIFNGIQMEVERSVMFCDTVLGKLGELILEGAFWISVD